MLEKVISRLEALLPHHVAGSYDPVQPSSPAGQNSTGNAVTDLAIIQRPLTTPVPDLYLSLKARAASTRPTAVSR